jgi:3-oxoacyl-[acyl-carrier-protein] synthase II
LREVVVTGIGVVSAYGVGASVLAEGIVSGRRALADLPFSTTGFPISLGGVAQGFEPKRFVARRKDLKLMNRDARLAIAAGVLAFEDAGLPLGDPDEGMGLYMGVGHEKGDVDDIAPAVAASMVGGRLSIDRLAARGLDLMNPLSSLKTLPNMPLAHVSIRVGARGPNLALAPDEWATEAAIAEAFAAVAEGECERALAGSADSLTTLSGFCLAWRHGRLGPGRLPAEGAALLVLESAEGAAARGVRPYARVEVGGPLTPRMGFAGAAQPAIELAAAHALGGRV